MRSGWVAGGGIEYRRRPPRVGLELEYLHIDFGIYEGYADNQEGFSFDNKVDLVRGG